MQTHTHTLIQLLKFFQHELLHHENIDGSIIVENVKTIDRLQFKLTQKVSWKENSSNSSLMLWMMKNTKHSLTDKWEVMAMRILRRKVYKRESVEFMITS